LTCSATDASIGWEILQNGTYEPHVVAFYRRTLKPGMVVADIGANIGFHALHAATLVRPGGRVIAFEPDPQSASLLKLSLSLNDGLPVDVIEAALSDAVGNVVLSDLGNAANSGARFTHPDRALLEGLVHGPDPRFGTVRALRWDDEYLATPVGLVKIDIEGFEPHALRGMEQSIERHRPLVLSEFAPSNLRSLGGVEPAAYLAWFRERGYRCAVLDGTSGEPVPASPADGDLSRQLGGRHHIDLVFTPDA
jgi:FkbM family methyltransferase